MVAVAVICTAPSATEATLLRDAVITSLALPYRRPITSGTVTAIALRIAGATNDTSRIPMPAATTYQPADSPHSPYALAATPTELPPPVSVAASVPAIISTPSLRPARW